MTSAPARRPWAWLVPALVVVVAAVLLLASQQQEPATPPAATQEDEPAPRAEAGGSGSADADDEDDAVEEDDATARSQDEGAPEAPDTARRDPDDPLAAGDVDAPVAMVVYSDYQCPFCAQWVQETQPTVMQDYVEEGLVRLEWRDVNVFGPESRTAARAAYAAGLQDGFWEYHDALYPDGEHRSGAELSEDALVELAGELGLDTERFRADLGSAEVAAAVQRNEDEGVALGAFSTPSFLVNGEPLVGAQPTEVFVDAIDAALETTR